MAVEEAAATTKSAAAHTVCSCFSKVHDCGWVLDEDTPSWPTVCAVKRQIIKCPENSEGPGARGKQAFELNGGSGTHVDAPAHFIAGGRTITDLTVEELVCVPLVVIDIDAECSVDPDHELTMEEVHRDEAEHGKIPPGSLVCIRSGWSRRCAAGRRKLQQRRAERQGGSEAGPIIDPWTEYHNAGKADDIHPLYKLPRMHFPGLSPESAAFIVNDRRAAGVGIDTLSPDPGATEGFAVHHAILGANKYIVENLNLAGLPARGAFVTVSPTAWTNAPEAPARVFAMLPPGVEMAAK